MSEPDTLVPAAETNGPGTLSAPFTLMPSSLAEAHEYAKLIAASDLVPADYRGKTANVLVAVQMGAELGLKPLQALQTIAIVNGRPTVYGDGLIALVRASPECEWVRELIDDETLTATCIAKRRGQPEGRRDFSQADAQTAGLWGRNGPWKQYPKRMLQMRARSWCLRDLFPDVLKGLNMAEEVRDYIDVTPMAVDSVQPGTDAPTRTARLAAQLAERAQAVREDLQAPGDGAEEKVAPAATGAPPPPETAPDEVVIDGEPDVLAQIAEARTEEDVAACAAAVNGLEPTQRRVAGMALQARIKKLKEAKT